MLTLLVQKLESCLDISTHLDKLGDSSPALLVYVKGDRTTKRPKSNVLQHVEALMEKLKAEAEIPQRKVHRGFTELKCSILSSARVIAGFFLPPTDNSLLSQRYWSLMTAILEVSLVSGCMTNAQTTYRQTMMNVPST